MIPRLVERPDGAKDVVSWELHTERDYHPVYALDRKRQGYINADDVRVHICVSFDNDDSAVEFEARVRAMLPEVK